MPGVHAKRAVLILAVVVLAVEGYYVYRFYDTFYGPTAPGTGASETKAETTTEPEKTTPGGSTVASVGEETAAEQQEVGSQQGEAGYVEVVGDIQTRAVEALLDSHNELLAYDTLTAADVEEMKANEAARLAHAMAADPAAVTEAAFDGYDGRVDEASALLRRSNELLGEDYETIGGVREVSPEF